jgi:Mrp family chromosome partitioning ATPase
MSIVPEKKVLPNIKRIVGVVSGKGGVGKSMTSVLLAQTFAARGLSVGIMDADITGPSIPRLLAIDSFRAEIDGEKLLPIQSEEGIKVLSINLFNEEEDQPVIWRGPLLGKVIDQFYSDGAWGELDYLIIDFPPGTSDVALTAFQTIPFAGIVVVGTPQDYVAMIVKKAVRMAAMMKAPVLGLVENMRTMVCPKCGEEIALFDDGSDPQAAKLGLPILASFPWRKELAQARSLRWSALGDPVKRDAEAFANQVELAIAMTAKA